MLIKIFDQSIPGDTQNSIEIELDEITTPEEIIRKRVAKEVKLYNSKAEKVIRGLVQPTRIERTLNGTKSKFKPVDFEKQIYVALDAFQKNGFFILIDDNQVTELDQQINLKKTSQIKFIKLTPLAGG